MATRSCRIPFQIHQDYDSDELKEVPEAVDDLRAEANEDDQEDDYLEESDDSDAFVDNVVREDMLRFQEAFKGIKDRFRLINRIGEGRPSHVIIMGFG